MKREKKINLVKKQKTKKAVSLKHWEERVYEIIIGKCKNPSKIELNFEELSRHLSNEKIRNLFIQLLEYYKEIDSEGAAYYWKLFDNHFNMDLEFIADDLVVFEDLEGEDSFYD